MVKPLKIPKGVAFLFCQDHITGKIIEEGEQHRPDLINNSIRNEFINNYMSNISPISLIKRSGYIITDVMFMSYFGRI